MFEKLHLYVEKLMKYDFAKYCILFPEILLFWLLAFKRYFCGSTVSIHLNIVIKLFDKYLP